MKNNKFLKKSFYILSTVLILFSCSSDDETAITEIQGAINAAKSGTWYISSYVDSNQNETTDYNGYEFTFNDDGTLTASNGANSIDGSWSITDDTSSSSSNDDIDFNISFISPPIFEELSDDWDILSVSTAKIDLIDISGNSGETDSLTFEKK